MVRRFLAILGRFLDLFERLSNWGSGWLIVFLMGLTLADVVRRFLVGKAIAGSYTLAEITMVGICFLALSFTQKQNGHVAMDFVVFRLRGKLHGFTQMTSLILSLLISSLLFYRSVVEAIVAVDIRLVTAGLVHWPAWPLKILVSFGLFLLCIRLLVQLKDRIGHFSSRPADYGD